MKSHPACIDCWVIYSATHLSYLSGSVSGVSLKVKTPQSVPREAQLVQAWCSWSDQTIDSRFNKAVLWAIVQDVKKNNVIDQTAEALKYNYQQNTQMKQFLKDKVEKF